jgi:DNA polymerase elongation subunit (family B)
MATTTKLKIAVTKSFRLFDFHVYDGALDETDDASGSDEQSQHDSQQFIIQMFGVNEKGETCSLYVNDYQPFFFVKVGDAWTALHASRFIDNLKSNVSKQFKNTIVSHDLVDRHKLYGFTGSKTSKFVKIVFQNQMSMRKYKNLWYNYVEEIDGGESRTNKKLKKVKFEGTSVELYESNIPPLLRYFHINKISPSGWVSFKVGRVVKSEPKQTTCTYEYICSLKELVPQPQKEARVPYKICSFDIEASSSHGDFPLPIKTYKNLAKNAVDIFLKQAQFLDVPKALVLMKRIILTAFKYDEFEDVDVVYPKKVLPKDRILALIQILNEKSISDAKKANSEDNSHLLTIDAMFDKIKNETADNVQEIDGTDDAHSESVVSPKYERGKKPVKINQAKSKLIDILLNPAYDRDEKIQITNDVLTLLFPQLEGDKVTVIGSTFLRYGETRPYFNHCLVLGTCDPVDNVEIQSVATEKELLLGWAALIQRENPDIIIGYNIFGFDYEFMFRRSQELACEREFLLLSRKIGDVCINETRDPETNRIVTSIESSKLAIASGEYDLRYCKMLGRLQIDMYAYFRRDFNLSSYKLDDVAGEFISDDVKTIVCTEHPEFGKVTELHSKNLMGLSVGDFIHIEISSFTSNYYKNGQKFRVLAIGQGQETGQGLNIITIAGHETLTTAKPVKWTMAKDDITPQDIFRLADRDASGRAIVAKYCIQDCNLVHHLMNKIDVLTGYVEMANICSVPISFLVFRGQGIKLTSFVAKKCMEKNTLMPDIEKTGDADGYEGAIVLPPKCGMYMDNPVACVDYSSLYPSSMISQNYSHDSKVWSKEYDLTGKLVAVTGERNKAGVFIYDNLPGYHYIDMEFDTFKYIRKTPTSRAEKTKVGTLVCRWAQFPDNKKGIMPAILEELLKARSDTRKMIKTESDPFMQNILDKRQLGYKVTANSLYGQCGSRTSTFYEKDVAAATTATGRQMIIYAKTMIEEVYKDRVHQLQCGESIRTKAEYIYGDSVANYTPIYVKVGDAFDICSIEDLAHRYGNELWTVCTEQGKQDKEVCELVGVETWTDKGWTKLHRVIRHQLASHKKIVRVLTHTGLVDVTDDHSLILSNGQEISPKDVVVGTELLHHSLPNGMINNEHSVTEEQAKVMGFFFGDGSCGNYDCPSGKKNSWALNNACPSLLNKYIELCKTAYPDYEWRAMDTIESSGVCKISPKSSKYGSIAEFVRNYRKKMYSDSAKIIPTEIMNADENIRQAFWEGLYDADGDKDSHGYVRIDQKNQISASHIAWLASSLGWKTSINTRSDKPNVYRVTMTKKTQRKNPNAIKKLHEIAYQGYVYDLTTDNHHFAAGIGNMIVHNTDSVFFTFNLENPETGEKIVGKPALEMTIELAQEAAKLCSQWLKHPMELSYEKTLMPFILLSKKRYVGMLYETNPDKGKLKFMGLSIKRRDSCDYLKDVYGGILNMLMDTSSPNSIKSAIDFLNQSMLDLVEGRIPMDKLMITKALRGYYKNPNTIGHNVLANRIGKRDPGNKPKPGDRMKFVFIVNQNPKALMGDKIETPEFIIENRLPVDYNHYITNQLMKPLQQLFGLALVQIWECQSKPKSVVKGYLKDMEKMSSENPDLEEFMKLKEKYCSKKIKALLFDKILTRITNEKNGMQPINKFFPSA